MDGVVVVDVVWAPANNKEDGQSDGCLYDACLHLLLRLQRRRTALS